jgi:hypothetical protein
MGKLIDIKSRIKLDNHKEITETAKAPEKASPVHDITAERLNAIRKERREVKRTILSEFIGAFVVLPERGLLKVSLFDISEKGISFDMELSDGHFNENEKIAMRIYLNHKTFFGFVVDVANVRLFEKEGIVRHGSNIVKGTVNDVALHHFVRFIETVSANLETDNGDLQVSHNS